MKKLILFILLLPSLCFAGPTDSYISFPSTGASGYVLDNAALEMGTNKYMAFGVRYRKNLLTWANYPSIFGKRSHPIGYSWSIYLEPAANLGIRGFVDQDGDLVSATILASPAGYANDLLTHTAVYQYKAVGDPTSGATFWVDGNLMAASAVAHNPVKDATSPIAIGTDGIVDTANFNGNIYQAFVAFADVPIIIETTAGVAAAVTAWSQQPGANPRPFTGAVSRYYEWGPEGMKSLPSGKLVETGVSTGKTSGQFDMSFSNHPTAHLFRGPILQGGGFMRGGREQIFIVP